MSRELEIALEEVRQLSAENLKLKTELNRTKKILRDMEVGVKYFNDIRLADMKEIEELKAKLKETNDTNRNNNSGPDLGYNTHGQISHNEEKN